MPALPAPDGKTYYWGQDGYRRLMADLAARREEKPETSGLCLTADDLEDMNQRIDRILAEVGSDKERRESLITTLTADIPDAMKGDRVVLDAIADKRMKRWARGEALREQMRERLEQSEKAEGSEI